MNLERITFETAKKATQKGLKTYIKPETIKFYHKLLSEGVTTSTNEFSDDKEHTPSFPQSIVHRWLREKWKIRVNVTQKVAGDFGFEIYVLNPKIEKIAGTPWIKEEGHFTKHYSTYEEALEAGLMEGLDLIPDSL